MEALTSQPLPVLPEQRPYLGPEELEAVRRVFESRWLGMGSVAKEFEAELQRRLGARHVLAVETGTAALHLALAALRLGGGDEVIVPSMTHAASVQAILAAGARPVFCEVSPDTITIDVEDAFARVTPQTRAIMPVHWGGAACDLDVLLPEARERGLLVVEDAAQAFGSSYKGRPIGTLGDVTCFSFDPIKNITCGDGGAVSTDDAEVAARLASLRNLGIDEDSWSRRDADHPWQYRIVGHGYHATLSDLNAAIGLAQLERFELFRERKRAIARRYDEAFSGLPGLALIRRDLDDAFPFLYTVRVLDGHRDALLAYLAREGIRCWVRPLPNHLQPAFGGVGEPLPASERLADEVMTLPLYFELADADCERVIGSVRSFFERTA